MKGPAGGPAVVSICVAMPGGSSRGVRLSARERSILAGRSSTGAKADFSAGRAAAHALLGAGVEVLKARDGRPVPARDGLRVRGLSLSIGHSHGVGMAGLVKDAKWVVGVDIETRSRVSARLGRRVLTALEKRRVRRLPAGQRARAAIEHWVLKEAALKTIGGGVARLLSAPDAAEVILLSHRGWGRIMLAGAGSVRARLIRAHGATMAVVLRPG